MHDIVCCSHSDVVLEAEVLAEREERLAVLLTPDFDDEGEAGVDEAAVYAKVAYEAQLAMKPRPHLNKNKPIQKKKTQLIVEIEKGSEGMTVEVDNPVEDVDVQIVDQKKGTQRPAPTPTPKQTPMKTSGTGVSNMIFCLFISRKNGKLYKWLLWLLEISMCGIPSNPFSLK